MGDHVLGSAAPDVVAPAIEEDRLEIGTKALAALVDEPGKLLDEDGKKVLHQVGRFVIAQLEPPRPGKEQGRVHFDEAFPRQALGRFSQAIEQTGRRRQHGPRTMKKSHS